MDTDLIRKSHVRYNNADDAHCTFFELCLQSGAANTTSTSNAVISHGIPHVWHNGLVSL